MYNTRVSRYIEFVIKEIVYRKYNGIDWYLISITFLIILFIKKNVYRKNKLHNIFEKLLNCTQ